MEGGAWFLWCVLLVYEGCRDFPFAWRTKGLEDRMIADFSSGLGLWVPGQRHFGNWHKNKLPTFGKGFKKEKKANRTPPAEELLRYTAAARSAGSPACPPTGLVV
jgi:hypothetical protein